MVIFFFRTQVACAPGVSGLPRRHGGIQVAKENLLRMRDFEKPQAQRFTSVPGLAPKIAEGRQVR